MDKLIKVVKYLLFIVALLTYLIFGYFSTTVHFAAKFDFTASAYLWTSIAACIGTILMFIWSSRSNKNDTFFLAAILIFSFAITALAFYFQAMIDPQNIREINPHMLDQLTLTFIITIGALVSYLLVLIYSVLQLHYKQKTRKMPLAVMIIVAILLAIFWAIFYPRSVLSAYSKMNERKNEQSIFSYTTSCGRVQGVVHVDGVRPNTQSNNIEFVSRELASMPSYASNINSWIVSRPLCKNPLILSRSGKKYKLDELLQMKIILGFIQSPNIKSSQVAIIYVID